MSTSATSLHAAGKAAAAEGREPVRFGRVTRAIVLLVLAQAKSYGYDIRRRLKEFGYDKSELDPGALYRLLRELEAEGFITSEWTTADTGPARRYYSLTDAGRDRLRQGARGMVIIKERAERFLAAYHELGLELPDPAPPLEGELVGQGRH